MYTFFCSMKLGWYWSVSWFDISIIHLNTKVLHQGNTIAMWFISVRMRDSIEI